MTFFGFYKAAAKRSAHLALEFGHKTHLIVVYVAGALGSFALIGAGVHFGEHELIVAPFLVLLVALLVGMVWAVYAIYRDEHKALVKIAPDVDKELAAFAGTKVTVPTLLVFRGQAQRNFRPDKDPEVCFHFSFVNSSLFNVYVKSVKGHAKFAGNELSGELKLMGECPDVARGQNGVFTIRQWITPQAANKIAAMTNPELLNKPTAEFAFDLATVTVGSREPGRENVEGRLQMPILWYAHIDEWAIHWPD